MVIPFQCSCAYVYCLYLFDYPDVLEFVWQTNAGWAHHWRRREVKSNLWFEPRFPRHRPWHCFRFRYLYSSSGCYFLQYLCLWTRAYPSLLGWYTGASRDLQWTWLGVSELNKLKPECVCKKITRVHTDWVRKIHKSGGLKTIHSRHTLMGAFKKIFTLHYITQSLIYTFTFQTLSAMITPQAIVILPETQGMNLLLCYDSKSFVQFYDSLAMLWNNESKIATVVFNCCKHFRLFQRLSQQFWCQFFCDRFSRFQDISFSFHFLITDEGVYVDTNGKLTKNVILQWGELPTSLGNNIRSLSISL